MLRIAYILGLLLLVFPSCKNAKGTSENLPAEASIAVNYLNTSVSVDSLLLLNKPDPIKHIYKEKGYVTFWHNRQDRAALLSIIEDAEFDGLFPEDYNVSLIKKFEERSNATKEESIKYDILLTETFHKLAIHLFKGRVEPSEIYPDWDLQPKELDVNKILTEALKKHSIEEELNRCRPPHAVYASLRNSLKYIKSLPDDSTLETIAFKKPISLNHSDSIDIPLIKKRLAYWKDLIAGDTTGIIYDHAVISAVKKFQIRHGICPHGKIDSTTAAELNVAKQQRMEQVMVNLERWKWFPYNLGGKSLLINIPDFHLAILEENDTIQIHKIVVGKPERRTPVLQSRFYSLVINPTWTVPPTIIKEDLTPAALEDPDYFARHNMTIYNYKGEQVDPFSWDIEKASSYRYVQGPGPDNALGEIKFNFSNKRRVYLHDTNHRELFQYHYRALSSGCVRVEDPHKLAAYMLKQEKYNSFTEEKIQEIIAARLTQTLGIKKSIHVHQLYWTAWMDKNGLQFRHDIYNLDNALYNKLITQKVSMPEYSSLKDDR